MTNKRFTLKNMTLIAMLSAIAAILTLLDFPLLFIAPSFYKLDFSEIPVLIGTFAMGPACGAVIELLKVLLNLLFNGTVTAFMGEISNFVMGCALVVPAGIVYKYLHTKKGAYISLAVGSLSYIIIGGLANAFILIPAYVNAFGITTEDIIKMGNAINDDIDSIWKFVLICTTPFNIIKAFLCSIVTAVLYKKVSHLIKEFRQK